MLADITIGRRHCDNNETRMQNEEHSQEPEVLLPGFRFHPTDEELVGYYLRRKVMQRRLSVEVITQLDIYKFDPWDLPKMAVAKGEKEWYFFCPRDRKYRNSARPNRVTGQGFWKATGTDRPIYSGDTSKCIGLKKSLVFYKGRAAKGIKTDWMMHEFRLPSYADASSLSNKILSEDASLLQDAWAVCRIFKKSTLAQRHGPASQQWAMAQHERAAGTQGFDVGHTPEDVSSTGADLELDASSPERSESTSEELDLEGCSMRLSDHQLPGSYSQQNAAYAAAAAHVQQLKNEHSTATWPMNMPNCNNISALGPLVVDSAGRGNCNVLRQRSSQNLNTNNEVFPSVDVVNNFLNQESPSVRGALDFVNCMLSSPRPGPQIINSNGAISIGSHNIENKRISIQMEQHGSHCGQDVENICPITVGPKMSTPMIEKFRRELSLQIPQGPFLQPFCSMQPWEILSPIFDLSTPSVSQLECM